MTGIPNRRVDDFLTAEEIVERQTPPDMFGWSLGVLPEVLLLLIIALLGLGSDHGPVQTLSAIMMVAVMADLVWQGTDTWFTRYVITDHRAIRVSGVIKIHCEWMAWSKVTDVTVTRTLLDRLSGTATIKVQSANEASGFKAMRDVPDPLSFADDIATMVNARQGRVVLPDRLVNRPRRRRAPLRR